MKYADLVSFRDDLLFNGAVQIGWFEHDVSLAEKAAKHYVFRTRLPVSAKMITVVDFVY